MNEWRVTAVSVCEIGVSRVRRRVGVGGVAKEHAGRRGSSVGHGPVEEGPGNALRASWSISRLLCLGAGEPGGARGAPHLWAAGIS